MVQKPLILAVETSSRAGSVAIALGEKILGESVFLGPARHSADLFPAIRNLLDRFTLKPQEIEHVYISIGPGSFTGLRIATTLAKTMHLATAVKIVTVDTLDVIAANVIDLTTKNTIRDLGDGKRITNYEKIAPILDAKRSQFFVAVYQRYPLKIELSSPRKQETIPTIRDTSCESRVTGHYMWKKTLPDALMTASQFIEKFAGSDKPIWLLGDGLLYHQNEFKAKGIRFLDQKYWSPQASKVQLLGWQKALAGHFADPMTLTPNYLRRPEAEDKWKQRNKRKSNAR